MNEWKLFRFTDFVDVNPKVPLEQSLSYSFVEMKDLEPNNKYCEPSTVRKLAGGARFIENDTVFARITPCLENGKICKVRKLINGVGFGSTEFHVLRGKPGISNNDFVYYLSRWSEVRDFAEINLHGTSGRQRVPKEAFNELTLLLPPLHEQQAIAEVLSSLDDKIDLLHRNNKTLEEMADLIFRKQYTDCLNPKWSMVQLQQVVDVRDGTHNSPKPVLTGHYLITSKHLKPSGIDYESAYCISETDFIDVNKRSKVDRGDILISMIGTLGLLHFVDYNPVYAIKNIGLIRTSKQPEYSYFILLLLRSPQGRQFVQESAEGSTQEYISLGSLRSFSFYCPDQSFLSSLNKTIQPLLEKTHNNNLQVKSLTELRNILLPKLMSGSIRVKDFTHELSAL